MYWKGEIYKMPENDRLRRKREVRLIIKYAVSRLQEGKVRYRKSRPGFSGLRPELWERESCRYERLAPFKSPEFVSSNRHANRGGSAFRKTASPFVYSQESYLRAGTGWASATTRTKKSDRRRLQERLTRDALMRMYLSADDSTNSDVVHRQLI